jgi:16S rRNA (guanine527-N7)-methyltransferase
LKTLMDVESPKPERHPAAAGIEQMESIFRSCGIGLSAAQLRQFWDYHTLLRERNAVLNLTRIRNFTNMVLKLYVDSVLPAKLTELPSPLLDLGTGPGMPGIPLKIWHPQLEVILAETRGPRVEFLHAAVERLQLSGIRVVGGRVTPRFEEPVAGVITRAVERLDLTLERVHGCLVRGGNAVFMKGPNCEDEIQLVRDRMARAYELVLDRPYRIPHTRHQRRLLVYRRLDDPPCRLRKQALQNHPVRSITSGQNPLFKDLKKLLTGRGIRKAGQAIVAGARPTAEILARRPKCCQAWLSCDDQPPPPAHSPASLQWIRMPRDLFEQLDVFGTRAPLLCIRLPEIRPWLPEEGFPQGCSLIVPFQDPENVGAAIRSAAAFGAAQVILLAESAHPFHPKALRASGGNALNVRLRQGPALMDLPPHLPIVALSAEGDDIRRIPLPPSFGLLAGLEGPGLPQAWRLKAVRIPIRPEVESLNAAAAAAVALYEWRCREEKGPKAEVGGQPPEIREAEGKEERF